MARWFRLLLRIGVSVLALTLVGCAYPPPQRQARLSALSPTTVTSSWQPPAQPTLQVAAAPLISPQATINTYTDLFAYIGAKYGRPVEVLQRRTYAEVNDLIRVGTIDLALVCSYPYVLGKQEFGMDMLAMPSIGGRAEYYSYLLVRADAGIASLEGLAGRTFAFTDPLSTSGRLAPEGLVKDLGATPETFFGRVIFTFSHDNSIKAVMDRLVDGAAVDSLVYDALAAQDPVVAQSLRIIAKSGPFGSPPFVVNPNLNTTDRDRLQDILLSMHRDPEGIRILAALGIDRFMPPNDAAFDSVRVLATKVRGKP